MEIKDYPGPVNIVPGLSIFDSVGQGSIPFLSLSTMKSSRSLSGAFLLCARQAHLLGGESPLHTRQGEVSAERQGCPLRGGI